MANRGSIALFKASINSGGDNEILPNAANEITGAKANEAYNDLADTVEAVKAKKESVTPGYIGTDQPTSGSTVYIPYIQVTSDGVISGYGTRPHTVPIQEFLDWYSGSTSASTLVSFPVTYRLGVATITSSQTLSLGGTLASGRELHIIVYNNSNSTITITLPSSGDYRCTSDTTLSVSAHSYAEINCVNISGYIYVRGVAQ